MKAGSDARTEQERLEVWFTLMRAQAAVFEALERDLEASPGLPLSWYQVLIGIAQDASGRMRMQELATFAVLSKSGLSRLVDRMEAAGLIRRESCSADRRGTYAALTPDGRKALAAATPVFLEGFERSVASHLSDADVRALQAALGKVLEANGKPASIACHPDVATASDPASRHASNPASGSPSNPASGSPSGAAEAVPARS